MTATQPDSDGTATQAKSGGLTRRGVMRKTAVGIGAAATVGGGAMTLENGPVQESEAVAPLFYAGAIGAGIAARWALDEVTPLLADEPPEGLTADALRQSVYQSARTRESTNASTILDNQNLATGIENTAWTEGKIAAIEELNAGSSEQAVTDAATAAANSYFATVEKNLLSTWTESVNELKTFFDSVDSHADLTVGNVFEFSTSGHPRDAMNALYLTDGTTTDDTKDTVTLSDGSTMTVPWITPEGPEGSTYWNPTDRLDSENTIYVNYDGSEVAYMIAPNWQPLWSDLTGASTNVSDGLITWVSSVYGSVQSGEIAISELVTPRERAAMISEDESISNALADLIALNIPVDLEREATIHIAETGTTLRGSFALTNEADGPIESGATYDPATFAGDAYFTTDISLLEGTWSAFETGVDGGTVTLTAEPYEGMVYEISTTADEAVSVPASDWIDSGTGTWTYDASASLETSITEVASVEYFAETDETQFETIGLDSPFTVERLENTTTGEEETSASFSATEPQDDTNYITQDEWDSLEQQNQELIEKYEESQNSGGGGGGLLGDSLGGDIQTLGIVAGGAALAALLFGNN